MTVQNTWSRNDADWTGLATPALKLAVDYALIGSDVTAQATGTIHYDVDLDYASVELANVTAFRGDDEVAHELSQVELAELRDKVEAAIERDYPTFDRAAKTAVLAID
jgi:hypothetical protein